jgi:methane/ammonia monooxygenase subunit B
VTGTVKVLETWPHTLEEPEIAAIVPVVPGPVFVMKDRTINDQSAIGSFFVEKGGIYQFKMTLLGKEPGKWHVHPGIAISGTGTLVGPGEWVNVKSSATSLSSP